MSETVKLILSLSVSGGLFALVLFALKPVMRNRLSKSFQYYIWLVVLLRFIVPFSFGINLMDLTPGTPNEPQTAEEAVIPYNNPATPVNPANVNPAVNNNAINNNEPIIPSTPVTTDGTKPFDVVKTLTENSLWIWLAGVAISAAWNMLGYLRFIRYVHGAAHAIEMPNCGAKVYKSRFAPTPMLVGVIKPRIYLPDIEYTDEQLDNILLHELTHLRRRDVWLKWFAALVVSVHWFNPIAYLMRREFNRTCELSCDEAVIRKLDGAAKQSYGDTLISVVAESHYPIGVMSVTMCEEKKKLKERLVAIMNYKKKTKITVLIATILTVTLTGCAFAFGAGFVAKNNDLIEMEIIRTPITEYSDSEQIKWGERTYSPSTDYQDGFKAGKQIGIIHDGKYHYNIYECEGLSTDRYLVSYYDVIMSTYGLFVADANYLTLAEVEKMNGQPQSTVRTYLGEANGVLSGFWGDIYELADGRQAILYYGSDSRVENIVVNANEEQDTDYDITLADLRQLAAKGDELAYEDFTQYGEQDVFTGMYQLYFRVEGGYGLHLIGGGPSDKPHLTRFSIPGVEEVIDIRYDDIDEFISKYAIPNESSVLPQIIDITVTREGLSELYVGSLNISSRFGYAVYLLPEFTFLEIDGCDAIQTSDENAPFKFIMQLYEVGASKPIPADEISDKYYTYYKHYDLGEKIIEVQFNYPNNPEVAENAPALMNAMADTIQLVKHRQPEESMYSDEFDAFINTWKLSGLFPANLTMTAENKRQFINYFQQLDNTAFNYVILLLQGIIDGTVTVTDELDDHESGVYLHGCEFCLYDMNGDGASEFILKTGVDEAGYRFTIYTIANGKLIDCGGLSGGHASLLTDGSGDFVRYIGHMGTYEITVSALEGTTLVTKEIASGELDYSKNEDYPELSVYGYGDYTRWLEFTGIPTLILAPKG